MKIKYRENMMLGGRERTTQTLEDLASSELARKKAEKTPKSADHIKVSFYMHKDLHRWLRIYAAAHGRPMSSLIEQLVTTYKEGDKS